MADAGAFELDCKGQLQGGIMGPSNAKIFWSTQKVDKLIALFREYPCLYDRTSREYNDKLLRLEALKTIAGELQLSPDHSDEVFRKIVNLRSQFRREKHREVRFLSEGSDAESAAAQIKWVHYKQLKFLDSFVTLRNPRNGNEHVQYSQVNGFGDLDESLDEDIDYDCTDLEEYNKVGEAEDCHIGNSTVSEGHHEDSGDNSFAFLRQTPMQDVGAKRQRVDTGNTHRQYLKRHLPYNHMQAHSSSEQVAHQSNGYENLNSSPLLQQAQSHLYQAFSYFDKAVGNSSFMKRRNTEDDDDDEDLIFARYIASELRQLKNRDMKRLVKHQIQNLVFEAHQKGTTDANS